MRVYLCRGSGAVRQRSRDGVDAPGTGRVLGGDERPTSSHDVTAITIVRTAQSGVNVWFAEVDLLGAGA